MVTWPSCHQALEVCLGLGEELTIQGAGSGEDAGFGVGNPGCGQNSAFLPTTSCPCSVLSTHGNAARAVRAERSELIVLGGQV